MTCEEFISKLEGVQESGGGWVARCPAHGDDNPSLSIARGEDGRVLVHCHAGCSAEQVVESMGLKMADLMPANDKSYRTVRGRWGKWVCDYVYTDEFGKVLYKSCRYVKDDGKKTFIIKTPDPDAKFGWSFGLSKNNIARVPYRLPRVVAAAKAGKSIVIVEGEKDADNLERVCRCAATCNVAGALKWGYRFPEGWGKWFQGARSILVIADNDPQFKEVEKKVRGKVVKVTIEHWRGQKHAADVRRQLIAAGFTGDIRLMVMPQVEGQPHVKDFTDWLEARTRAGLKADRDAFLEAVKNAEPWPTEWDFDGEAIERAVKDQDREKRTRPGEQGNTDVAPAAESGRESESSAPADGGEKFVEAGRFGRLSPRSPSEGERWYLVDFQMSAGKIARFEIGEHRFAFEGWVKSEDDATRGQYVRTAAWTPVEGNLRQFVGLAIGCMVGWDHGFKVSGPVRLEVTSSVALAWLRARGKFFADANNPMYDTSLYFDTPRGVLYLLHSNEFGSFLATEASVNREDKVFKYMMSLVDDLALNEDATPRVVPSKEWERKGDAIYISNGDSRVYKVSANKVEDVPNGTDGVVFVRGATLSPWKLLDGPGVDPFKESMLFRLAALEKDTDRMNCRLWWLNLFACHANKPILLVTGPKGSGKTRLLQGMKQFLGMREDGKPDDTVNDIDPTDKGLDSFWVIEDKGRFEIFDNYDSKIKWAENAFQTAATNGSSKRRELYKTQTLVTLSANAYMGVTSNNPIFTTEGGGLPDRIITARVCSGRKVSVGDELRRDIEAHRNEYLTWLVNVLKAALADDKPVDKSINRRHPDYGVFAVRCSRAFGDEAGAIQAMEAAEIDKATLPLLNDVVAKEIVAVLREQVPPGSLKFTASDMSGMVIARLGEDESDDNTRKIYGARRIGKAINKLSREFSTLFCWTSGTIEGRTRYDFTGLTTQGKLVFDSSGGGLVDSKGLFDKSPTGESERADFSENNTTNPPNPPYARASAHTSPSSLEDEDGGDSGDGDFGDDLGFDL